MKMKKTLSLLLAAMMTAGLAGCGSKAADSDAPDGDGDPTTLTVAMECAYAPYNWTQSDDSNGAIQIRDSSDYAYGYDVMMAKKIAEALGQNVQIVKLDWDSLIPAVMSGDVDCVIAGQSITAERSQQVDFSDPYYYASIITLVKKDSPYASATSVADLAGAVCTSQLGTIWYDNCLPQIPGATILAAQETAPAMLVALDSGACDVVVTDRPTAQAALVAYPDFVALDFGGGENDFQVSDEDINIGISMKKGNTALQTIPVDKQRDPIWKRALIKLMHGVLRCYVELFRGTPMIVQAVFIYYGLMQLFNIKLGMWATGFLIVSINTGAYMAETVRGGIVSIDPGQTEGAMAIGMNHWQTMLHVILPQALRNIIPQIGNNFIINIKDTSVLSVISITDLFFVHKSVVGALYTYFESATIVMIIYLTMTLLASYLLRLWEKALDGPQNYDLNTTDTLAYTSGMHNAPDPVHEPQNLDMKGGAAHV